MPVTSHKDEEKQARQELLRELTDLQKKWADHRVQIAALSPKDRATFDRLWQENGGDDGLDEKVKYARTRETSPFGMWTNK